MKNTATQDNGHSALIWVTRKRPVLVTAIAFVPLMMLLEVMSNQRGTIMTISFVVAASLFGVLGGVLMAVTQIVVLLKAIRSELMLIRARLETEVVDDIASDLTAVRAQMGKGVLGLLGM